MSVQPTPTDTEPHEDHARYYRAILHDLIDMGASLARQVHRQATAEPATPATDHTDHTIAFDRIARTVRRTIVLARILDQPLAARKQPSATIARHQAARKRVLREVEDTIQRTASGPRARALHEELLDRLDRPDLASDLLDDIGHLPVEQIIADICRDLGLANAGGAHPWKRRTPDDILLLNTRAAGQPTAAAPAADRPPDIRPPIPLDPGRSPQAASR